MTTRGVVDHVTISIAAETILEAGDPIPANDPIGFPGQVRILMGSGGGTATLWVEKGQVLRLIAALVAADSAPDPDAVKPPEIFNPEPPF
jgi:hypothetical protein